MKLSLAIVASLASVVAAGNLRAASNDQKDWVSVDVQGRATMTGLLHAPTASDLVVLDQVVLAAYNSIYEKANMAMAGLSSKGSVSLDDETTMIVSEFEAKSLGGYCSYCIPDDVDDWECYVDPNCGRMEGLSELEVETVRAGVLQAAFEKKMCKKLRASGVANFAQVADCAFNFVETPGALTTRISEQNAYESNNGKVADVELVMMGLTEDMSQDAINFLEAAVVEAHNDAFAKTSYQLKSFETVSAIETDDAMNGAELILGHAMPVIVGSEDESADLASVHQTFEMAFCSKLQNSRLAVFANVHGCVFRFVYNPVTESKDIAANVASA